MGRTYSVINQSLTEGSQPPLAASPVPVVTPGRLYNVPQLPPHYLVRKDILVELKKRLLTGETKKIGIFATTPKLGIQGMGGIGKTIAAAAIALDREIRHNFSDGLIWVDVGKKPDIITLQAQICDLFEKHIPTFYTKQQGKSHLSKLLADKACLLILDDVWKVKDASGFEALCPDCRLLLTTRNESVVNGVGAEKVHLELLNKEQALDLLRKSSDTPPEIDLPTEALELVRECGFLPLAIAMVGSMVRHKPLNRWNLSLRLLKNADIKQIQAHFINYPYPDIFRAIHVSIESLSPLYRARYLDLAIFPENYYIHESVFDTFWADEDMQGTLPWQILDHFVENSLAHRGYNDGISLHNLQFDYIRKFAVDLIEIHKRLVDAYERKCTGSWATGPSDGYYHKFIIHHLLEVRRLSDAKDAAKDFLLGVSGLHPNLGLKYLRFLGEEGKSTARLLLKRRTTPGTLIRFCLKLLGHEARNDAMQLLKTSNSPEVLCECLDLLELNAREDAKKLIETSNSHEVLCRCIDILGDEAIGEAKQLIKKHDTHPFVLCRCLDLLGSLSKNDDRRLIKISNSHEVLCKCLDVLGIEAKDDAKRLIADVTTNPYVICRCLNLLGDEATDDAKRLLTSLTHPFILCSCLSILGKEATSFAVDQLKNWKKANKPLLIRCFQIAGNTLEAKMAAEEMLNAWDEKLPSILRVASLRAPFDSPLRTQRANEVISCWHRTYRPLVSAALAAHWNSPEDVENCCRDIISRWHSEILYQRKNRKIRRYDGHIIKALSNPLVATQAMEVAEQMRLTETQQPGFLTSELHKQVQNILNGEYLPWVVPIVDATGENDTI